MTIETMLTLTDNDLKQMGVHQMGLRKAILKNVDLQRSMVSDQERARAKEKNLELEVNVKAMVGNSCTCKAKRKE